jgi:hypothetical protein
MSTADDFRALDLRCHKLLADVPLHDVWVIELEGGGPGRTMRDVYTVAAQPAKRPWAVRALFTLRFIVGRLFRTDTPRHDPISESYVNRLTDDDRARSLVPPGTMRGLFRTLYAFSDEALAEARNATVHAFLAMALSARPGGYRLYWAVYVKPVGALTSAYMALIDPFRRYIVYPALIREMQAAWARTYTPS